MVEAAKVASPNRGQLKRENVRFPVPVHALYFGLARRTRPACPARACSFSTLRLNTVLTRGIPPDFRIGVHLLLQSYVIGSVPSLSWGHHAIQCPMAFTVEGPPVQGQ